MPLFLVFATWGTIGWAQEMEVVGTRALGMGGAFVAVADDASATYWNPAGLGTGPNLSAVFDWGEGDPRTDSDQPLGSENGSWHAARMIAAAMPAFGASYYRLESRAVRAASLSDAPAEPGTAMAESLITNHFGVTFVQSLFEGVVVGSTLRLVRGEAASVSVTGATIGQGLESVADLQGRVSTDFDFDVGAMLAFGIGRAGIVLRNLRQATFEGLQPTDPTLRLSRQVRAGAALTPGRHGAAPGATTTLAVDVDLLRVPGIEGDARNVAIGGEHYLADMRVALRGGLRISTLGEADPLGSVGVSVAPRRGMYVDGQLTRGGGGADTSWSVGVRLTF